MPESQPAQNQPAQANRPGPRIPVTPELVSKVADRVFVLLLNDLRIERERRRWSALNPFRLKGGR